MKISVATTTAGGCKRILLLGKSCLESETTRHLLLSDVTALVLLVVCLLVLCWHGQLWYLGASSQLTPSASHIVKDLPLSLQEKLNADVLAEEFGGEQLFLLKRSQPLRRLLSSRAIANSVLLLSANIGYLDLLKNSLCRLKELRLTNFVVAANDAAVYEWLLERKYPAFPSTDMDHHEDTMAQSLDESDSPAFVFADADAEPSARILTVAQQFTLFNHANASYRAAYIGTSEFAQISQLKLLQTHRILTLGFHVLVCDVDVFLFQNPFVFLNVQPHLLDIQVLSDRKGDSAALAHLANSGFMFIHSSPQTLSAFGTMLDLMRSSPTRTDQAILNSVLCGPDYEYRTDATRTVKDVTATMLIEHQKRTRMKALTSDADWVASPVSYDDPMARIVSSCENPKLHVVTRFLPQSMFMNGNMWKRYGHVWRAPREQLDDSLSLDTGAGPSPRAQDSESPVIAVHMNWNYGYEVKRTELQSSGMWVPDARGQCQAELSALSETTVS